MFAYLKRDLHDHTREEHDKYVQEVLDICRQHSLTLNHEKFVLEVTEMVLIGDVLSDQVIKPDSKKVSAIQDFSTSTKREALQRFLGMIN